MSHLTVCKRGFCCGLLLCLAGSLGLAQTPAENIPLKFAQHDLSRAQAANTAAQGVLTAKTSELQAVEKAIADATTAKAAAEKAVADAAAAVPVAEKAALDTTAAAKAASDAALAAQNDAAATPEAKQAAQVAADEANKAATLAADALKTALANQTAAAAALPATVTQLEAVTATLKPAQEAKAVAEKDAGALTPIVTAVEQKVALYTATPPIAAPENVRLLSALAHTRAFQTVRIDPTGDFVFGGAQDNSIQRWDILLGAKIPLAAHKSWVSDFDFQPGTNLLISGGYEGQAQWWGTPLATPQPVRAVPAHKGQLRALAFSRDGQFIATAGNDKLVRIWNAADGQLVRALEGHTSHVYNLAFHPSGKHLVSGELLGVLKQWEVGTWELVRDYDAKALHKFDEGFRADCGGIRGMDFSPDGRLLAAGGIGEVTNAFAGIGKPTVLIFDWLTGQRIHLLNTKANFQGSVWGLQFHPSGKFLVGVGGGGSGGMWFWDAEKGTALHDVALPAVGYDVSFHPDTLRMAIACYDNHVRMYDLGPAPPAAAK